MENIDRIGKVESIALLITVIINNIIFNVPAIILNLTGTGSWVNIIYLTILAFVFIFIICKLLKPFSQLDLLDISEYIGGKFLKIILGIAYIFLFISFAGACLRYLAYSLHLIYFENTSLLYLMLLFLIPVVIATKRGLKAISGTNLFFIPMIMISILVLFISVSKDFVWQRLFPVFGYGIKNLFFTQIGNISIFNVIAYLYFIRPFLKNHQHFKYISIFCIVICSIYFILSILTLLMAFPFITDTDQTLSLYLLTRSASLGNFFERVDAIFIFLWILNLISFLSLNIFFINNIVKKLLKIKYPSELTYTSALILLGVAVSFKNIAVVKVFNRNFYKIYDAVLVFVVSFFIILLAYFKKRRKEKFNEIK